MLSDFLVARLANANRVLAYRPTKVALGTWTIVCTYDTALSQIIPASLGERFPRVRDAIAMTSGWLPFWAWLLILAAILVAASFEFAFRRTQTKVTSEPPNAPRPAPFRRPDQLPALYRRRRGTVTFDYTTYNGVVSIGSGEREFIIAFSGGGYGAHVMARRHRWSSNLERIARVKSANKGDRIRFDDYNSTSSSYYIRVGERFIAENVNGYFLQAQIIKTTAEGINEDKNQIVFKYAINAERDPNFEAI